MVNKTVAKQYADNFMWDGDEESGVTGTDFWATKRSGTKACTAKCILALCEPASNQAPFFAVSLCGPPFSPLAPSSVAISFCCDSSPCADTLDHRWGVLFVPPGRALGASKAVAQAKRAAPPSARGIEAPVRPDSRLLS